MSNTHLLATEIWITTGEGKASKHDGSDYISHLRIGTIIAVDAEGNWFEPTKDLGEDDEKRHWIFQTSVKGTIPLFRDYWELLWTKGREGAPYFDAIRNVPKKLMNRGSGIYSTEENAFRKQLRAEFAKQYCNSRTPRLKTIAIVG